MSQSVALNELTPAADLVSKGFEFEQEGMLEESEDDGPPYRPP